MRSRRSPSFPSGLAKKKKEKETPSAAASGGQRRRRRRRLGDGVLGAPGSCSPRPVGARAGAARDPGRARGAPRGQYGRLPPGPGVRALGALRLRGGGGGERGSAGKSGRARPGAPRGAAPAGRGPRAAPRERQRETGKEAKWSPFVLPAPHCWPLRAAGPHLPPPPPLPRRARPAEVAAGRGPGPGPGARGGGRAGRAFPPPGRAPAGTTSSSPAWPGARPARRPRRGRTFRVGRTKRKKFRRRGGRGRAPGQPGPGAAPRRLFPLVLRGRGEAPFFPSRVLFPAPRGKLGRGARAGARRGLIQREAPRRGWPPAAHAAPRRREAAGLGARRGHRRPRRHTLARTHSGASRFAAADGHGRRACVCRRVAAPRRPRVLFPEAAQAAVGSRGPRG